jgi:hypothetical protein
VGARRGPARLAPAPAARLPRGTAMSPSAPPMLARLVAIALLTASATAGAAVVTRSARSRRSPSMASETLSVTCDAFSSYSIALGPGQGSLLARRLEVRAASSRTTSIPTCCASPSGVTARRARRSSAAAARARASRSTDASRRASWCRRASMGTSSR